MRLFLFILTFIPTASNAALLQKLSNPTLENLASFAIAYEKDSGAFTRSSQFISVIKAKSTSSEIRIQIQDLRTDTVGEYSRPSYVDIEPLTIKADIEDAIYALFTHQNTMKEPEIAAWQNAWITKTPAPDTNLKSYLSIDSNSFGGCRSLAFEDLIHKEILVIGNCYSE